MGPREYVLLIVAAACIITLICIIKKCKIEPPPAPPIPSPSRDTPDGPKGTEKPSETAQNTIYAFEAKSTKRLCPFCDGENDLRAATCIICGRDLV